MRVSIIVPDMTVVVDGEGYVVSNVTRNLNDEDITAVQWYDDHGEVEYGTHWNAEEQRYERHPNVIITDFGPFNGYLAAWRIAKADHEKQVEEQKKMIAEQTPSGPPLLERKP